MRKTLSIIISVAGILMIPGGSLYSSQKNFDSIADSRQDTIQGAEAVLYQSDNLIVRKLSNHVYQHISYLKTKDFGKVDCNGMIVVNQNEAIVFDTPADETSSEELIKYLSQKLECKIKAVIPTHFHEDCVAGLATFNKYRIPVYASAKTIRLLNDKGMKLSELPIPFDHKLVLFAGNKEVIAEYFGEGHTKDNIIGYFPEDKVLFGGCLIKASGATKGNLEDANTKKWPKTARQLQKKYGMADIVIPGHGRPGGSELIDYTIRLFE